MTTVVAFGHTSRVGKDYCAQRFTEVYYDMYQIRRYKYANLLKDFAFRLTLTCSPDYYERHPERRHVRLQGFTKTAIETWTSFGDHLREYDPCIWARPVCTQILTDQPHFALITDLRFPVEVDLLRELADFNAFSLYFIKLTCPDNPPLNTVADHALDAFCGWHLHVDKPYGQAEHVWLAVQNFLRSEQVIP